tara:strand:+ start:1256 stop:1816 length:561 start_codon:yes stop_codon:yes gene_type:complete
MAFQLSDGTPIPLDAPFSIGTTNYPANWLRLSTAEEKTAAGIVTVADPTVYDYRFYEDNGNPKEIDDKNTVDSVTGELVKKADGTQHITYGLKTNFKKEEKSIAASLLGKYDWYVTRKSEKGTAIPTEIQTYRDAVRTACTTREAEIDACSDVAALVTLYGATYDKDGNLEKFNMTQYPDDPNATL